MEGKKLIAFDLYDTCLEFTVPQETLSYKKLFSDLGVLNKRKELKYALLTSCRSVEDILSDIIPGIQVANFMDDYTATLHHEIMSVQLFPETQSTLSLLRNRWYKIAAVSNLSQPYIEPFQRLLSHTFDYELFSSDIGFIKPDPKIFECLQNISWYNADEIVMVGDSLSSDIQWAKNANITPIHIERNENNLKKKPECMQITSLAELLDIFQSIC